MVSHTHNRIDTDRTHDSRSLTELIKELRDEGTLLMRKEVELAKTEMTEKVNRVVPSLASIGVGAGLALCGAISLVAFAVVGLYLLLDYAGLSNATSGVLSPLIIGILAVAIGYAMIQGAISRIRRETLVPERTVESLREDKEWVQSKVTT